MDADSKRPVESWVRPTETMVAAAAYDKNQNKLFFTPMRVGELRWLDLSAKGDAQKFYTVKSSLLNSGEDLRDEAKNFTRMVIGADGKSVTVTLPPVQIFNRDSILNNAKTRVYDRQQGLLAPPNANLESDARHQAEGQLLQAACDEGIMQRTTDDATQTVSKMLSLFELEATVLPGPVPPCP